MIVSPPTAPLARDVIRILAESMKSVSTPHASDNPFEQMQMIEFADDVLGVELWDEQRRIFEAVETHKFVAVASCHAIGKTFTSARIAVSFLQTNKDSIVVSTAPTGRQVKDLLWREIGSAASGARVPLNAKRQHPLQVRWDITDDWYAVGFKSGDQNTDAAQGYHAKSGKLLVIVDEGAGVSEATFNSVRRILTGTGARMLVVGNPTSMGGTFREAFHERSNLWHTISIPADQTPNFLAFGITREDIENGTWQEKVTGEYPYPSLIDPSYAAQEIEYSGRDHPDIKSRIWAEWPMGGIDTLIALTDIERAQGKLGETIEDVLSDDVDDVNTIGTPVAGLDVANYGGDETSIWVRLGELTLGFKAWRFSDNDENVMIADQFLQEIEDAYGDLLGFQKSEIRINVDSTGIGTDVGKKLRQMGYSVREVNFAEKSSDSEKWPNIRHEMWWQLADRFREGRIRFVGLLDSMTRSQISDIKYSPNSRYTQPVIESKEAAKKRGRKSPDRAESMMLAYANLKPAVKTRLGRRSLAGGVASTSHVPPTRGSRKNRP